MTTKVTRRAIQQTKAVELYLAGATTQVIGQRLEVSERTVARWLSAWRAQAVQAHALELDELRAIALERLDRLHAAYWSRSITGDADAAKITLMVEDRQHKLQGIEPPQRVDLTITTDLDREVAQLLESLRELDAGPAMLEAEVVDEDLGAAP